MTLQSIKALALQMEVMDQVQDSVVATDLDGTIASWNRGAERLHGYTAEEAIGRHVSLLYPPEEWASSRRSRLGEILETGYREFVVTARTKMGRLHPINVRLSLIRNATGDPVGILSIAFDLSDAQRARAELADRERQLQTILDALPLVVGHVDRELRFKFANKAYERWTGLSPADLVGRPIRDLAVVDFDRLLPDVQKVLSGTPTTSETEVRGADGAIHTMIVQRIPDVGDGDQVRGYFVVWTDVTEIKRAELERVEAERRLRDALVAEVHHRVKNALQGIIGLLRTQASRDPALEGALTPAISQVMSIAVGFGLTSARDQGCVVLCDLVREIARNLEQITGAEISIEVDREVLDRPIALDPALAVNLGLVVNELIFNAVKHGEAPAAGPRVVASLNRTGNAAALRVENRVVATPATFDFHAGKGLGTGLNLVRALLPARGAALSFAADAGRMTAALLLQSDVLGPAVPTRA